MAVNEVHSTKILIGSRLQKQINKRQTSSSTKYKILKIITILQSASKKSINDLEGYLNNKNNKKLKGGTDLFKFQLDSGDRVYWTWTSNIPSIENNIKSGIMLVGYSPHDDQSRKGKINYQNDKYIDSEEYQKMLDDEIYKEVVEEDKLFDEQTTLPVIMVPNNICEKTDEELKNISLKNLTIVYPANKQIV